MKHLNYPNLERVPKSTEDEPVTSDPPPEHNPLILRIPQDYDEGRNDDRIVHIIPGQPIKEGSPQPFYVTWQPNGTPRERWGFPVYVPSKGLAAGVGVVIDVTKSPSVAHVLSLSNGDLLWSGAHWNAPMAVNDYLKSLDNPANSAGESEVA